MQKRNIQGIERVIFLMTKRLEQEPKGPSNKSATALARLISAYNRATRPISKGQQPNVELSEEEKMELLFQNGDPHYYSRMAGEK